MSLDNLLNLSIIYCTLNIQKDYKQYKKKSRGLFD